MLNQMRDIGAARNRRLYPRHHVQLQGTVNQQDTRQRCLVLDLSVNGARLYCPADMEIGGNITFSIGNDTPSLSGTPVWTSGPIKGIAFERELDTLPSQRRSRSFFKKFSGETARGIELFLAVISVVVGALGILYVAVQTKEIRRQNDLQTQQSQLQTVLQVEDSERFINQLLISSEDLHSVLAPDLSEGEFKQQTLAHVFLQEWEKMFRLRQKCIINNVLWKKGYEPLIRGLAQTEFIAKVLRQPEKLTGYHPDFVYYIRNLVAGNSLQLTTIAASYKLCQDM